MAEVLHSSFNDYETLAIAITDAMLHGHQVSTGTLKSELTHIHFENLNLQLCNMEGAKYVSYGEIPQDVTGLVFNMHEKIDITLNGRDFDSNSFVIHPAGSEHFSKGRSVCNWGYLSFNWDYLNKHSNNFQDDSLKLLETFSFYSLKNRTIFENLKSRLKEIRAIAIFNPDMLQNKDYAENIENDLIEQSISLLISSSPELKRFKSTEHQTKIMKDFFDLVHFETIQKMDMNNICAKLGVSLRTFYYTFEKIYNLSPVKFLEIIRLHQARKDLLTNEYIPGIVTQIAITHGFWHFGRFAENYRKLFDERPSDTIKNKIKLSK